MAIYRRLHEVFEAAGSFTLTAIVTVAGFLPCRLTATPWCETAAIPALTAGLAFALLYWALNLRGLEHRAEKCVRFSDNAMRQNKNLERLSDSDKIDNALVTLNPVLTLCGMAAGALQARAASFILTAQISGAMAGVIFAQWAMNLDAVHNPPAQAFSYTSLAVAFIAAFCTCFLYGHSLRQRKASAALSLCIAAWRYPKTAHTFRRDAVILGIIMAAAGLLAPLSGFGNPAFTISATLTAGPLSIPPWQAASVLMAQLAGFACYALFRQTASAG